MKTIQLILDNMWVLFNFGFWISIISIPIIVFIIEIKYLKKKRISIQQYIGEWVEYLLIIMFIFYFIISLLGIVHKFIVPLF